MSQKTFVTYSQIEAEATGHYRKYGTKTGFKNIVHTLFRQGKEQTGIPNLPYDVTWNNLDDDAFFQVLKQLPVTKTFPDFRFSTKETADISIAAEAIMPEALEVYAIAYVSNIVENMHTHNFFEINYVMSGSCRMVFENESRSLNCGEFCIIAPCSRHDVTVDDDSVVVSLMIRKATFETTFFQLLAREDLLASFFRNILYSKTETANYMLFSTNNSADLKNILKDIFMECYITDPYSNTCIINRVFLLFALLLRRFDNTIEFYDRQKSIGEHEDFAQILLYIQKNYAAVTLQSLAEAFHYNPSYLSTMIKKNTGRTLVDILTELKMSKASDLLSHTNLKVSKIAGLVGYDSVDHFSRLFKKTFGVPPKEYAFQAQECQAPV